jgi:hypothetical protein
MGFNSAFKGLTPCKENTFCQIIYETGGFVSCNVEGTYLPERTLSLLIRMAAVTSPDKVNFIHCFGPNVITFSSKHNYTTSCQDNTRTGGQEIEVTKHVTVWI